MAHEISPQLRVALNPREAPAHRADRLWILYAELSTPQGLLHAAAWLPSAWPHMLQLVADPHPEVRAAAAQLLGHLGAVLAAQREPSLMGRMPGSALLDWGLALLSPTSTLPAAQRMTAEAKEAALTALYICVLAMPPPVVAPYAEPLLRLTTALLEATNTPPRLLGPMLRLLLAALPAVPLAALGQGFSDLADLLCGWALEPLVVPADRQLISLILHALRPQWHSHPDLTASLTENMLNDVKAAAAAMAAAAADSSGGGGDDADAQAVSCMKLLQLLCDIFSAASLRQLPVSDPFGTAGAAQNQPAQHRNLQNPQQQAPAPQPAQHDPQLAALPQGRGPQAASAAVPHGMPINVLQPNVVQKQQALQQKHLQATLPHQLVVGSQPSQLPATAKVYAANAGQMRAGPPTMPVLALTAILPTRPGAVTVRHLVGLYPRLLASLNEVRGTLVRLEEGSPSSAVPKAEWAAQLCSCVETLADSVSSLASGIDPRDVDEVWEGVGNDVRLRLAALTLQDAADDDAGAVDFKASLSISPSHGSSTHLDGPGSYGIVGSVAVAVMPQVFAGCGTASTRGSREEDGNELDTVSALRPARDSESSARRAALRTWALETALQWTLSLLSGAGCKEEVAGRRQRWALASGPGPDADAVLSCTVRLLNRAVEQGSDGARRLLLDLVLKGDGASAGVCRFRSIPQTASVATAAKLLQALISHADESVAAASLDWLLADLRSQMAAVRLGGIQPRASQPRASPATPSRSDAAAGLDCGAAGAAVAVSFDCAVLQAACQRGLLSAKSLLRVEATTWAALQVGHALTSPSANLQAVAEADTKGKAAVEPSASGGEQGKGPSTGRETQPTSALLLQAEASGKAPAKQPREGSSSRLAPPASVAFALCEAWAAAGVAVIAAVCSTGTGPSVEGTAVPGQSPSAALQPRGAGPTPTCITASRACCTAYLHAVHALQGGPDRTGDPGLQLRALAALRQLIRSPAVGASGALGCEAQFRLAVDALSPGFTFWDARVRAAAADCAAALATHVLQPLPTGVAVTAAAGTVSTASDGPLGSPTVPRPEAFSPLAAFALDGLSDPSTDAAAAAARLTTELSEAALLVELRGPASCGLWVPAWQDSLAVGPQIRAPRVQQLTRLLELVFQSSAAQGSVLLRKRSPAAGAAGAAASEDGDGAGRLEALQRLAAGMTHVEAVGEQAGPGGDDVAGGSSSGTTVERAEAAAAGGADAEGRSSAALVWLALHEGAKSMVAFRLRTQLGGPTQTLGALERMLQVTYSRLSQERRDAGPAGVGPAGRDSAWLALEFVGGLERAVAHAAEGHAGRDALPQPVLAFFAANQKVCEEWFTRGRELLARIASLASAHHHAAHHGLLRLRDMRNAMRQLLANLAKERSKAAAAASAAEAKGSRKDAGSTVDPAGAAPAAAAAAAAPGSSAPADSASQSAPAVARHGGKQLQRRGGGHGGGASGHPAQAAATAAAAAEPCPAPAGDGGAAGEASTTAPSAVQQLEGNLSRLALTVVEMLKLVGGAFLAMGEADSLQGLHAWASREFEPLLQGDHLPGASAVAAATAAAAAEALASREALLGTSGLGTLKRRPEATRATRAGSSGNKLQKDAFAWLLGLGLQAAGSYEQALLSYNAFLAPPQPPGAAPNAAGSPGGDAAPAPPPQPPNPTQSVTLELSAAAQGFVVERVAECYAALTDWTGLQGLVGAFSRTAASEPTVAGWWPGAAASIEHRFRALAAFDTASAPPPTTQTTSGGEPTSAILAALRALEGGPSGPPPRAAQPASASAPPAGAARSRPPARDLAAVRAAAALELSRVVDRLRANALSEPTAQRELLLQASCLRGALRGLSVDTETRGAGIAPASSADGPWYGLLLPQAVRAAPAARPVSAAPSSGFGFGLGRALLAPDGGLQACVIRNVAVTASLLRCARGADPRVSLPGTQALSVEHIRAAAASSNWGLGMRLVQAASARAGSPELDGVSAAGARAVLSVVHSLVSASSGRLLPGQVVDMQLRALLPHLAPSPVVTGPHGPHATPGHMLQPPPPPPLRAPRVADADADDLACALCTLARWMLKASVGAVHHHHSQPPPPQQQQQMPHGSPHMLTSADQVHTHGRAPVGDSAAAGRHPYIRGGRGGPPPGFLQHDLPQPQQLAQPQQQPQQQQQAHAVPLPGFAGAPAAGPAAARTGNASAGTPPWLGAADWPALNSFLLRQHASQHTAGASGTAAGPNPQSAFMVPEALLQSCYAPAACYLRALQLSPASERAWKAWGDLLYRATKEQRARAGRPPLLPSAGRHAAGASPDAGGGGSGPGPPAALAEGAPGTWASMGYGAAAAAYCRYLALSYGHDAALRLEEVLPVLLQVLHIIVRHAGPIERLLEAQLAAVPPGVWTAITPQLLAQLPGAGGASRRLLGMLLHAVARVAPSLVLYPAVVEVRAADAAAAAAAAATADESAAADAAVGASAAEAGCGSMVPELRVLLADLGRRRPGLLTGVEMMVAEMERLTVLWDERWAALLAEVEVEIARRAVSLQAEATRIADDAALTAEQRQALLASRYSTLMAPAVMLLERQLRATAAMPPETPHEQRFAATVLPRLRAAAAALRDGAGVRDWARPSAAWAPLRAVAAALAREQRQPLPPMVELSPRLAALQGSEVPMPGCQGDDLEAGAAAAGGGVPWEVEGPSAMGGAGGAAGPAVSWAASSTAVTVTGVCSELVALNTKTRPKRVALLGSDGRRYTYLLKGREDLRMDERLMQVLRTINAMLQADSAAAARGLAVVRCYSVTPLGPRAGLIQWVPATTSLFAVFRQWQSATLERHAAMVAARQEGVTKAVAEGAPHPPEVDAPPVAAATRPMDLFYSKLVTALQERGLSSATPRRSWPADLLRSVFTGLASTTPRQLLARMLWAGGGSAALSWRRQQRYSRSLAVMSCVGHLLGLGDRHLDNILLEGREAGVVHIDYNVCWDKGSKLRVPEVVPFRLTQLLSAALGVGGLEGVFRAACEATFACLRRRREALVGLADAVLSDPGVDWAVEREDMAARQDMELAVALNLFISRAEEAQRQLQQAEEDLPVVLEGPVGVLLLYVEAQTFAEAMRSAATEAQQRIQQAKTALEAANRAEAEAGAIVAAAAQEAASLAAEGNALSNAVPQLLQQCAAWAQQHAGTLGVLREGSFLEGTLATGASWRAVESGCALGLLAPVASSGHVSLTAAAPLALLPAVMGGDGAALGQLPEDLLRTCHDCDCQAADLLGRREGALYDAIAALTQYGTIVRKLLPPAYPGTSYHHRWAQALAALAAGGLALPAVTQAQALAPREPRPLDVAASWQALRGTHRLATAAAVVLAPGVAAADVAAAVPGHAVGARVLGSELAGAVATATKALAGSVAVVLAEARDRHSAAVAAADGRARGVDGASTAQLAAHLVELLQRHPQAQQQPHSRSGLAPATASAAATAFLGLVRGASSRIRALKHFPVHLAAEQAQEGALRDFLRLDGEVAGLVAAATALAEARLAAQLLGGATLYSSRGGGGSSRSLTALPQHSQGGSPLAVSRAATPGLYGVGGGCGVPWLAAAAAACSRWPEIVQRLAADVAPEIAGQLHVGGGNGGGGGSASGGVAQRVRPDTPLAQALADLRSMLRAVDDALKAGRDVHARTQALEELRTTYHDRRADLLRRGASDPGSADPGTVPQSGVAPGRESWAMDLQALDAAWVSRDAVAADLSAAAAAAADALAAALRHLYISVLGPSRLPVELQANDAAAGAGLEGGWAESGDCGHAAVAGAMAWWDVVTESLEGVYRYDGARDGSSSGSCFQVPPVMRPLWRCVETVHLLDASLSACQRAVKLTAPPGTDGALLESYSAVLQSLVRAAADHMTARLLPHLLNSLAGLEAHLLTAVAERLALETDLDGSVHLPRAQDGSGAAQRLGNKGRDASGGVGDGSGPLADAETPELVPFTDFAPVGGGADLLGALEDDEDVGGVGGGGIGEGEGEAWDEFDDGPGGAASGDDADGYDLDLGLDLDLDDGFGGGAEEVEEVASGFDGASGSGSEAEPRARRDGASGPALLPPVSHEQVSALLECLAARAAATATASAVAAVDPAAASGSALAGGVVIVPAPWAASPEARGLRAARLQCLAAYEWMHEHHLLQALPAGDPRCGQALAQFFAAQATDPLQPSSRVTAASRLGLLTQLQSALDALPQLEQAVSGWEAAVAGVVSQAVGLLRGSPERFPVDTALAAQRANMLMGRRQQWLSESRAGVMRVCQVSEALLQFEYSRQGITWSVGGAAVADGFAAHCQLLARAEVLATLAAGGSEAGRAAAVAEASQRAAEAARQAADARYALELAQYEEVAASSQLQAHLPLLVSRSLDLGAALVEAEPVVRGLVQLLSGKLGPALKEISNVSVQHTAAADVASVAAAVTSHFERSRQAAEALAAALPATQAALTAADAAAPLPPDMANEVGFLSAQLLGGATAAAATRDRAMALMQHTAAPAVALQPMVHTVHELPRGLAQLSTELSALAAAAGSIAAAVESKHLLPALENQEQQRQDQAEAHTPPAEAPPTVGPSEAFNQLTGPTVSSQARTPADGEHVVGGTPPEAAAAAAISGGIAAMPAAKGHAAAAKVTSGARMLVNQRGGVAADHVQHHRSRRSAADEARRRAFAAGALRRFIDKLEGREAEDMGGASGPGGAAALTPQPLAVSEQVDLLVRRATSVDRLSQMYEGWTAWL